jgi:hypothetical protein
MMEESPYLLTDQLDENDSDLFLSVPPSFRLLRILFEFDSSQIHREGLPSAILRNTDNPGKNFYSD